MTTPDLNDLIGSRICHDLISPLGAIGNGVELLAMSGIGAVPEMALIEESVQNANARIKYYRVAFGASSRTAQLGATEMRNVVAAMFKTARMLVDWTVVKDQPRDQAKLAFLLLQCIEGALPWGGTVTVSENGGRWSMTGSTERLKKDDGLWAILTGAAPATEVLAADVHFALAPLAASAAGRRIDVDWSENEVVVSF